jgi:hypothetical protein
LYFLDSIAKNIQISNFINIRLVGVEMFHANRWVGGQTGGRIEGRTDKWTDRGTGTMKLIIAFLNFAKARKEETKEGTKKRANEESESEWSRKFKGNSYRLNCWAAY